MCMDKGLHKFFAGMRTVVNSLIVISVIVPLFMTVSVQFPISDTTHGPYQRCIGRFETEFKPLDPDPVTPGKFFNKIRILSKVEFRAC